MIELHSRKIEKARNEVTAFLNRSPSLFSLAAYHKCTSEWHNHLPNEFNSEVLRLLDDHFTKRRINIKDFY